MNENKTVSSLTVAKEFLRLAHESGKLLTPMKLIKLVYIAHGWMLGLYRRPLIRESVEAWKYGPVINELYQAIKQYRGSPVEEINGCDTDRHLDSDEQDIIRQTFDMYGNETAVQLSMLTHSQGSPWEVTWKSAGQTISNDLIEYHYKNLADKAREKSLNNG